MLNIISYISQVCPHKVELILCSYRGGRYLVPNPQNGQLGPLCFQEGKKQPSLYSSRADHNQYVTITPTLSHINPPHISYFTVAITLINGLSVQLTARVITAFSTSKVIAIGFIAAVGAIFTLQNGVFPEVFRDPFRTIENHVTTPSTIALALYGVLWSYDGW